MLQWEYRVTIHQLPELHVEGKEEKIIECDQSGLCFVHGALGGGLEWLEGIFREEGERGWELVQSGYHNRELLCIWKRRREETRD
jgi:hypothetical protein